MASVWNSSDSGSFIKVYCYNSSISWLATAANPLLYLIYKLSFIQIGKTTVCMYVYICVCVCVYM
jgi:hypothetical protein